MNKKREDLSGRKFGRLTVKEFARAGNNRQSIWRCECDCGNFVEVSRNRLLSGHTKSCGCLGTHGGKGTRLYNIWRGMKQRCFNPNNRQYNDYGGRGITVCDEWKNDFPAFRDWALTHGYRDDLSIDRINNDSSYEPGNCRWTTAKVQSNNRRPRRTGYHRMTIAEMNEAVNAANERAEKAEAEVARLNALLRELTKSTTN